MALRHLLRILGTDRSEASNLTREDAFKAFRAILSGTESDVLIASFLVTLRWKGITAEELMGFAQAARVEARIPCQGMPGLVSVSPPHDGHERYAPLDAAACLIAAGAGARVLLISDRCVPPKRGVTAANVLETLGLSMTWDPTEAEAWVAKGRFAAVSIAGLLPAMVPLRRIRGDLVMRSPLSTVEKLLAPAGAAVVLGAQGGPVLGTAVEVIQGLGHERGIAIQGLEGSVVPSVRKRTRGIELSEHHLVPVTVEPEDFGLHGAEEPELPIFGPPDEGQGPADNPALVKAAGDITRSVLAGEAGSARDATLLSSAILLKASGRALTLAEGVDAATESLDSGAANAVVEELRSLLG